MGYEGGRYVGHAVGTAVEIGAGYDPARSKETLGSDWALIRLNRELSGGDHVLETLREPPPVGARRRQHVCRSLSASASTRPSRRRARRLSARIPFNRRH